MERSSGVECSIAPASLNMQQFPHLQLDDKKDQVQLEGLKLELFILLLEETLREKHGFWEKASLSYSCSVLALLR